MTQWGLDNLFNPGKRHMDDEKRRLQSTREEIGDNSGGRRIDLEAGKVSIAVPSATDIALDDLIDADDTALDPALEAEELPALALADDEAEIVPEVAAASAVDAAHEDTVPTAADDATPSPVAATEPDRVDGDGDDEQATASSVADDVPIETAPVEPVVAAPRRRQLSASAWSRRG